MLRLERRWTRLAQDETLQRELFIESEFRQRFAVAHSGTWTLELKVPDFKTAKVD